MPPYKYFRDPPIGDREIVFISNLTIITKVDTAADMFTTLARVCPGYEIKSISVTDVYMTYLVSISPRLLDRYALDQPELPWRALKTDAEKLKCVIVLMPSHFGPPQ